MNNFKSIGEYTYINDSKIIGDGNVTIGKFCSIGENVRFITWGHNINWFSTYPFGYSNETNDFDKIENHPLYKNGITIGNDVWIGDSSIILDGVKIGDGAVISAGSLVTKNVKPYSVVGGNPSEFIFTRFNKEIVDILLKLKWWDLPIDEIKKIYPILCSNNVEELKKISNENMKICVISPSFEEIEILPFYLDYYINKICVDNIFIYEGGDVNKMIEISKEYNNVHIIKMNHKTSDERELRRIRNEEWKKYKDDYDWIVVCDMDEFIYYDGDLKSKLQEYKNNGITIPLIEGFDMISMEHPTYNKGNYITNSIQNGIKEPVWLNKKMIFDPKQISDINYDLGTHSCNPIGNIKYSENEELKLLHYKWLSYEYLTRTNKEKYDRLSDWNLEGGCGAHYKTYSELEINSYINRFESSIKVINNDIKKDKIFELLTQQTRMFQNKNTDGDVNILYGLYDLIKENVTENTTMCEIGSYAGVSSELFAIHCKEIFCVDPWLPYSEISDGNLLEEAELRFDKISKKYTNIIKYKMSSIDGCNLFPNESLDLIYIDGEHTYESVKKDILNWLPKIKKTGKISGHDYYSWGSYVKTIVDELFPNIPIKFYSDSSWLIEMKDIYKPIYLFSHNYLINNWEDILTNQLQIIKSSNLYNNMTNLFMYSFGDDNNYNKLINIINLYDINNKIILNRIETNFYEYPTLQELYKFSQITNDSYILYFHFKGVWSQSDVTKNQQAITSWRKCLEYFNIEKWNDCINKLNDGYEVVGALYNYNKLEPLFSGNFWWANTNYIKKLKYPQYIKEENPYLNTPDDDGTWCRVECEKWINTIPNNYYNFYIPKDYGFYFVPIKEEDYKKPKISIITPTYNRNETLINCINSVIKQNYDNFEMLICHDGPWIKEFYYDDKRISYYNTPNKTNNYGATQRNYLLNKITGDYIIYLDDDNILYDNYINKMIEQIDSNTGMVICRTHFNDRNWTNLILPRQDKIIPCEIDSLNILLKKEIGIQIKWDDIDIGHDHRYISNCESLINSNNLTIKYIPDILSKHQFLGEKSPRPITIFNHNYLINNWKDIVTEQLQLMLDSNLYKSCRHIYSFITSDNIDNINEFQSIINNFDVDNKITVKINTNNNYEFDCLQYISEFSQGTPSDICYFHTKGVYSESIPENIGVKSWRNYLNYFTITKWKDNVDKLIDYDVVGVDYNYNDIHKDYVIGGNFFWTKSEYIKTLPYPIYNQDRFQSEHWILLNPNRNVFELFNVEKLGYNNLYLQPLPKHIYKQLKICLVCISKDEDNYIEEWLKYNRKLGFDHIYMYENDWNCNIDLPYLTKIPWNGKAQQSVAYNNFIQNYKDQYDYVAFFDCDEFLTLKKHKNIHELINDYYGKHLSVNWQFYGSQGKLYKESNNLLKTFTKRQSDVNHNIKTFVYLKDDNLQMNLAHKPHNKTTYDTNNNPIYDIYNPNGTDDVCILNHYSDKTKEDYVIRINRGSVDVLNRYDSIDFWLERINDNIDVVDTTARDFMYSNLDNVLKQHRMYKDTSDSPYNLVIGLQKLIEENLSSNTIMCEIGSFSGVSSELFALYCKHIYCIDPWNLMDYTHDNKWGYDNPIIEESEQRFNTMLSNYNNITKIKDFSYNTLKSFDDNFFDCIYIDGDHTYESVKNDILMSISKIKKNGIICGHDYTTITDVKKAVDEIFPNIPIKIYEDSSWLINLKNYNQTINHFYEDIEGWFNFEDIYTDMVNQFDNAHFVEVGSWLGKSTSYMGVEIINSNKNIKFDCVDTWEGSKEHIQYDEVLLKNLYDYFLDNMKPIINHINPIRLTSIEASKLYQDNSLDFVFINVAHDYDNVYQDILHWYPKVKLNGYIGGHDYNMGDFPGVVKAVNELIGQNNIQIINWSWLHYKSSLNLPTQQPTSLIPPRTHNQVQSGSYSPLTTQPQTIVTNPASSHTETTQLTSVVISSYPNHNSSISITENCLKQFKSHNFTTILTSHYPIPISLQSLSDYNIYDNNNILITHDHFTNSWKETDEYYMNINLTKNENNLNHSLTVYMNYYNGIVTSKQLGYKYTICTNYDNVISNTDFKTLENILQDLRTKDCTGFFMSKNQGDMKTIFFIIENDFFLSNFERFNTKEEYLESVFKNKSLTNCLEDYFGSILLREVNDINLHQNEKTILKNNLILQKIEEKELFNTSDINLCSNIEYITLLPLKDDPSKFVCWYSSSNQIDSGYLRLKIECCNGASERFKKTVRIKGDFQYYKIVDFDRNNYIITFTIMDNYQNVIKEKVLKLSFDDLKDLKDNGIFELKQKQDSTIDMRDTLQINARVEGNIFIRSNQDLNNVTVLIYETNHSCIYNSGNINLNSGIEYWFSPDNKSYLLGCVVEIFNSNNEMIFEKIIN